MRSRGAAAAARGGSDQRPRAIGGGAPPPADAQACAASSLLHCPDAPRVVAFLRAYFEQMRGPKLLYLCS